jgi:hypothetical protein
VIATCTDPSNEAKAEEEGSQMGLAHESVRAMTEEVMSSEEAVHVSLIKVTPRSGKETLGTWWFHCQHGGRTQSRPEPTQEMELG